MVVPGGEEEGSGSVADMLLFGGGFCVCVREREREIEREQLRYPDVGEVCRCEIGVRAGRYICQAVPDLSTSRSIFPRLDHQYIPFVYHEQGIFPIQMVIHRDGRFVNINAPVKKTPIGAHRSARIEVAFGG